MSAEVVLCTHKTTSSASLVLKFVLQFTNSYLTQFSSIFDGNCIRWYIQHLIHESGYLYDDDESNYPLSEDKWMLQTHGKFMKYVLFTLHRMTPEQMKMNPIKPIIKVKTNQELDKEEGGGNHR